MKSKS